MEFDSKVLAKLVTDEIGKGYITRPLSDSEAATMYKLKRQSSNMQTGQSFEHRELVRLADSSS